MSVTAMVRNTYYYLVVQNTTSSSLQAEVIICQDRLTSSQELSTRYILQVAKNDICICKWGCPYPEYHDKRKANKTSPSLDWF